MFTNNDDVNVLPPSVDRAERRFATWQEAQLACGMRIPPKVRELFKQNRWEQKTDEWHLARREAITASDFASAIGINPYSSQNQLIKKKIDPTSDLFMGSAATRHGEKYEDCALHLYEQNTPGAFTLDFGLMSHVYLFDSMPLEWVEDREKMREWFHRVHEGDLAAEYADWIWLKGSPDGVTLIPQADGSVKAVLLEIKCPFKNFFEGKIAQYYYAQVQLLMHLLDLDECHFVQYCPPEEPFFPKRYDMQVIPRDREWMAAAKNEARHVWQHIQNRRQNGGMMALEPSATSTTVRQQSDLKNLERLLHFPPNVINPKKYVSSIKRVEPEHPAHARDADIEFVE